MNKKICFTIMGFGKKTDFSTGKTFDLDKTYLNIIKPVVEKLGYTSVRADEIQDSAIIDKSMYALLIKADLVIADITTLNPNAIYELGIRHAARKNHTIILKDKEGKIPFDLDHNRFLIYSHLGEDVGVSEAQICQKRLKAIIESIENSNITDSPLFESLPYINQHSISDEEFDNIVQILSKKEKSLFAITEQAINLKNKKKFNESALLWEKASKILPEEEYFIQQHSLCTYKSEKPSLDVSLTKALTIISKIYIEGKTNNPETLGLVGAIYKRMYNSNKDIETLRSAITAYKRGFILSDDYYTGENYATCLDLLSLKTTDKEESMSSKFLAKEVRKEIIEILEKKELLDSNKEEKKWIYATMANCYFNLGNTSEAKKYEELFIKSEPLEWEKETYFNHKPVNNKE